MTQKPYHYIGKDGKTVLAADLEDERDALRAANARLREDARQVVKWFDTVAPHQKGPRIERLRAALKETTK